MLFKALTTSSLLIASAYAVAQPYKPVVARMSANQIFGLVGRQDNGYQPSQNPCGQGDTCAEACGPTTVECPSNNGLSCYDPSLGQKCCPDGSGNACDAGYFCTTDSVGGTWCCPDGMDLVSCAAAYSLTVSLISETATPTSSVASSTSSPASTSVTTSSTTPTTPTSVASTTTSSAAGAVTTTVQETDTTTVCPSSGTGSTAAPTNGTITSLTPSPSGFISAAAANVVHGGLQAVALAVVALLAL